MSRHRCALEYACAARPIRSDDESLRDLGESAVLGADQVGRRHARVDVGQLGGVRGPPAHLVQLAGDLESGCALLDHQQRNPRRARAAGAHRGDDVVGAHPGGDVGLGAVDDVVVAIQHRRGAQMPDVGTAAGLGDGQRADLLAGQRRPDERVDQPLVARGDHVRHRDAAGEQRGEDAAGRAGLVQLLADDHRVGAVAATAADRFGEARAQQAGRPGAPVQVARQVAGALPLVDVGQDLAFGERAHRLSQLFALGRGPDVHKSPSGMSTWRLRSHSPSPLACGSNRA